jgi:predicted transcriptional regulator
MKGRAWSVLAALAVVAVTAIVVLGLGTIQTASGKPAAVGSDCGLANGIKHVIQIQFDNTHFLRDRANVPSDLEQMPHLLNFIRGNGTLLTNDHTVLISHTATGILSTLTGNYPDRFGVPVSNSFRYFRPDGSTRTGVAFAYWTAPLYDPGGPPFPPPAQTDLTPEMINEQGKVSPAPWVPWTRAGCDVGQVSTANTILENTGIDIPTFFGPGSPEAIQAAGDSPGASATQTFADYVGIGVHCAQGSAICAAGHSRPDLLPDEPRGYNGFSALMGAKYVDPVIKPTGPMTDLNGNVIKDQNNHIGFPGFDGMAATVSLSWVAQMQEAGIPITQAYISDAHDGHGNSGNIHFAYAPGEAGYVQQLHDYDTAFGQFFDRLAADGINKSNTLFLFTVDEGDHFAGSQPNNPSCDGVTVACDYTGKPVGEINADLRRMVKTQFGDNTLFTVHSDDAPNVYITGNPSQTAPVTRTLEREMSQLSGPNPYTGQQQNNIMVALADQTEMKTLHMMSADPNRNPTFTPFADPDWFFFATGGATPTPCTAPPPAAPCITIPARTSQSFAWNHGDIQDEIASTWAGYVGPGVMNLGDDNNIWTDHTDHRPTLLTLAGLKDDYQTDGRAITQIADVNALPVSLRVHHPSLERLGDVYKQLTAPFGSFGMYTLVASTRALASNAPGDATYASLESQIADLTSQRDALAAEIRAGINSAETGTNVDENQIKDWIQRSNDLLAQAQALASS